MPVWLEIEGNLITGEDLVEEELDISNVAMPQEYHDFWKDRNFRIPRGEISDLVLERGDQFNGVLSKYARMRDGSAGDYRIVTLETHGYYGYCKTNWDVRIDNTDAIKKEHLRVGLVYRYEVLKVGEKKKSIIFAARPIYLVVGEDAKKLNYKKHIS